MTEGGGGGGAGIKGAWDSAGSGGTEGSRELRRAPE